MSSLTVPRERTVSRSRSFLRTICYVSGPRAPLIVLAGTCGVGKSTVGTRLADALGIEFLEADELHPMHARCRQRSETDRDGRESLPWLRRLAIRINNAALADRGLVVSYSALKRSHRQALRRACRHVRMALLFAPRSVVEERLTTRFVGFSASQQIDSQFRTLELPAALEPIDVLDARLPIDVLVDDMAARFRWQTSPAVWRG